MSENNRFIVRADAETGAVRFSHPLNEHSDVHLRPLSRQTGMTRLGVSHARVPPGKESYVYHSHQTEEEFVFILSGRGIAVIDGEEYEVGPGDFMAFPTPSVGHHLRNPQTEDHAEDLVYLTGGENHDVEIADFPELGKRMYRNGEATDIVDHKDIQGWPGT